MDGASCCVAIEDNRRELLHLHLDGCHPDPFTHAGLPISCSDISSSDQFHGSPNLAGSWKDSCVSLDDAKINTGSSHQVVRTMRRFISWWRIFEIRNRSLILLWAIVRSTQRKRSRPNCLAGFPSIEAVRKYLSGLERKV